MYLKYTWLPYVLGCALTNRWGQK